MQSIQPLPPSLTGLICSPEKSIAKSLQIHFSIVRGIRVSYSWLVSDAESPSSNHQSKRQTITAEILRDFKSYMNEEYIGCMGHINESRKDWLQMHFGEAAKDIKRVAHYKIWQDGNHPIELSTNEMIEQRIHYTHFNPVEAGMVSEPEYYNWSSAIDYAGGKGLLTGENLD